MTLAELLWRLAEVGAVVGFGRAPRECTFPCADREAALRALQEHEGSLLVVTDEVALPARTLALLRWWSLSIADLLLRVDDPTAELGEYPAVRARTLAAEAERSCYFLPQAAGRALSVAWECDGYGRTGSRREGTARESATPRRPNERTSRSGPLVTRGARRRVARDRGDEQRAGGTKTSGRTPRRRRRSAPADTDARSPETPGTPRRAQPRLRSREKPE